MEAVAVRNRGLKCGAAVAVVPKAPTRRGGSPSHEPVGSDSMQVAERAARMMLANQIALSKTQKVSWTVIGSFRLHRAAEAAWHQGIDLKRPSIASILSPLESCSRQSWIPCPWEG